MHFNGNPFTCSYAEGGKTSLNGFQFGTFIGRFPSDGAENTAVNGLKGNRSPDADIVQELCESRGGRPGLSVLTSLLVSVDVKIY